MHIYIYYYNINADVHVFEFMLVYYVCRLVVARASLFNASISSRAQGQTDSAGFWKLKV